MADTIEIDKYLNLQMTSQEGRKRSIKIKSPKTDATARKTATKNFVDNYLLNDSANILSINGVDKIIAVTAEYVDTSKTSEGTYGESIPLALSTYEVTVSANNSVTVEVLNANGATITAKYAGDMSSPVSVTINQETDILTITNDTSSTMTIYYVIAANGYACALKITTTTT